MKLKTAPESGQKPPEKSSLPILLVLLSAVILLAVLTQTNFTHEAGLLLRKFTGNMPDVPQLVIDVPFKNMRKIYAKREAAIQQGMLVQGTDDFVSGDLRLDGRSVSIKLRLKGDWIDHLLGDKWSYRIHVRDGEQVLGMRKFSIQSPETRGFQGELLFHETMRRYGVLAPRYMFVEAIINGDSMGTMALEEFFSKELLESSNRREGVIVRFDEKLVWAARDTLSKNSGVAGADAGFDGAFDNYHNATVDAFGSGKIAESEYLSKHFAIGVGLLRGFSEGHLLASEVFDVASMGRFLAIAEMYGSWHSLRWHNLRFYLNPVSMRLEPIAFDANLSNIYDNRFSVMIRDTFTFDLLQDPSMFASYRAALEQLNRDVADGSLIEFLSALDVQARDILSLEMGQTDAYPFVLFGSRLQAMLAATDGPQKSAETLALNRGFETAVYPTLLHAHRIAAGAQGEILELSSAVPWLVEVAAIEWVSADGGQRIPLEAEITFPLALAPRPFAERAAIRKIAIVPPEGAENYVLNISAGFPNRNWKYNIPATHYYPALLQAPVPGSNIAEQLEAHSFLELRPGTQEMFIPPGRWTVNSSIVVPPGYSLHVGSGTELLFAADAALIAHGYLKFAGVPGAPVVLAPSAETWPGLAVLEAKQHSSLSNAQIRGTSGVALDGWSLTGGINFYKSNVLIERCEFTDSRGEDALNIINSGFEIRDSIIAVTASDAFDADFSTGKVIGVAFNDVGSSGGGDAVDVSGSQVEVVDASFLRVSDKAISVGERSELSAENVTMDAVGTGFAAKDGSSGKIVDSIMQNVRFAGLTAYIKKPEFGPASIVADNVEIHGSETQVLVQSGSSISVNGEFVTPQDVDVDELYATIMRKGLKR